MSWGARLGKLHAIFTAVVLSRARQARKTVPPYSTSGLHVTGQGLESQTLGAVPPSSRTGLYRTRHALGNHSQEAALPSSIADNCRARQFLGSHIG